MHDATDTIAAIATAAGEGAVSIVRVSGPASLAIADRLVVCGGDRPSQRAANSFFHGHLRARWADTGQGDGLVDEVIVLIFRAPHSYTREDSIEIQGHGGPTAARRILRAVLDAGARLAEPGEFTQRAFLSGRIDLLQAEAVLDLIRARSDRAASAAVEQLSGSLSCTFNAIYDDIMAVGADIEATLDFSEEELPEGVLHGLEGRLKAVKARLESLLATWDEGRLLREGAMVAVLGRPNVGKSTLLNALLGASRAIVHDMPGTTRDVIEESMVIAGVAIRIADTAGLRATECRIESEGIQRAMALMDRAEYVLYVVDASQPASPEDQEHLSRLSPSRTVIVLNKCDQQVICDEGIFPGWMAVRTSLLSGAGLDQVRSELSRKLLAGPATPPHAVVAERHRRLLLQARSELEESISLLGRQSDEVALAASGIRASLESLGQVTGRDYHDELLSSVFSRFCIGK
jgi:tRNA modification GTPase